MARNKHPEVTVNRILDTSLHLFLEKGYEHTTIQDIVDALGDLSKGAIYHHFKSKEDIVSAVADRMFGFEVEEKCRELIADPNLTGLQKLQKVTCLSLNNPNQEMFLHAVPTFLKNPRFLAESLFSDMQTIAPELLAPILQLGVDDGTIHTEYPQELAEVALLLCDIWLNPMIFSYSKEGLTQRFHFAQQLLEQQGAPILTNEMLERIQVYGEICSKNRQNTADE